MLSYSFTISYPGSAEIEKENEEEKRMIALRDSLYKIKHKKHEPGPKKMKEETTVEVEIIKDKLEKNPKYFEQQGNVVCAVMNRFKDQWINKTVVTDLTGSMYPYMKQVFTWHVFQHMEKGDVRYVFFNDGDGMSDKRKKTGKTGGIHHTQAQNIDTLIDVMYYTMSLGNGGDGPENDAEALLFGQKYKNADDELILIADNYSSVKDIVLASELNVPVRIILCGVKHKGVHPDYIEIAHKTNGSIHTVEEDIMNLAQIVEGGTVTINKCSYKFTKGKFFKIKQI